MSSTVVPWSEPGEFLAVADLLADPTAASLAKAEQKLAAWDLRVDRMHAGKIHF